MKEWLNYPDNVPQDEANVIFAYMGEDGLTHRHGWYSKEYSGFKVYGDLRSVFDKSVKAYFEYPEAPYDRMGKKI